jgi:hypothetical protein
MTRCAPWRSLLCFVLSTACGDGGAIPDGTDAAADAPPVCECPPAEVLTADRIVRAAGTISTVVGVIHRCSASEKLLAGSCIRTALEPEKAIFYTGFSNFAGDDNWQCSWRNPTFEVTLITHTVICLTGSDNQVALHAEDCECLPPEPVVNRFIRVAQAGNLPSMGTAMIASECDEGDLLIGGGCAVEYASSDYRTSLYSAGFAPDGTWRCAWKNPYTETFTGTATALCLRPPAPGTAPEHEPLGDRIVRKERASMLPAGNVYLQEVTCDAGDSLLWGSCALENPDPTLADVHLFRSGFVDEDQARPNTWQCAWNNLTDLTPTAIATAVCLKPPSL